MKFLTGDFDGRNIIPLNIIYDRGDYNHNSNDVIDIIYKDLDTGKKYVETIPNPKIEIWITKPEHRNYRYIRNFFDKEKCYVKYVHYKTRFNELANELGVTPEEAKASPYLFQADMKIEHFYLMQFILEYPTDKAKTLSIGYLDIENDIIRLAGFPNPGEAPINAVTYVDGSTKSAYTFVLVKDYLPVVPKEHPDYQSFEDMKENFYRQVDELNEEINSGKFFEALHELFDEFYGSDFNYNIEFFTEEIDLLNSLWTCIRNCNNDYVFVWNLPYDMMNLIERPKVLGYDPASLMVDDQFLKHGNRSVNFVEDTNPLIQKRRHTCDTYSLGSFIDQMVEYVGIRVGKGKLASAKLGSVAQHELGDTKLDYHEDANIKTLFYVNLKKFIIYNIKD